MARLGHFLPLLAVLGFLPLMAGGQDLLSDDNNRIYVSFESNYSPDGGTYCLDVDAESGTNAIMTPCDPDSTSQWWYIVNDVVHNYNEDCLDVCKISQIGKVCDPYVSLNTKQVIVHECNGGDNQSWQTSGSQLVSSFNSDCLDMCKGSRCAVPNDAITYTCNNNDNQQWKIGFVGVGKA